MDRDCPRRCQAPRLLDSYGTGETPGTGRGGVARGHDECDKFGSCGVGSNPTKSRESEAAGESQGTDGSLFAYDASQWASDASQWASDASQWASDASQSACDAPEAEGWQRFTAL